MKPVPVQRSDFPSQGMAFQSQPCFVHLLCVPHCGAPNTPGVSEGSGQEQPVFLALLCSVLSRMGQHAGPKSPANILWRLFETELCSELMRNPWEARNCSGNACAQRLIQNLARVYLLTMCVCSCAGLANLLSKVFVPGFTSDSLRELATKNPDKFVVAEKGGILGIEEVLDMVDDHLNSFVLG